MAPRPRSRVRRRRLSWPVVALAIVACGGSGGATTEALDAGAVLAKAGPVLQGLSTVEFEIDVAGDPVFIDDAELLAASGALGQYRAPDAFKAVVDVKAYGISAQVGAVSIGDRQWISNPVTGAWERLPPGYGFDPLTLFDPERGLGATLENGVQQPTLLGREGGSYVVQGVIAGDRVAALTAGLVEEGSVSIELVIDSASFRTTEARFATGAGKSNWTVRFRGFGEPVTIDPPESE